MFAGRAHVGVAEEMLRRIDVAEHLLAPRRALVDDAGAREAAVPPAVERRPGRRLTAILPDHGFLRATLLRIQQVLQRISAPRELCELLAQLLGRDRRVPDLPALPVDAQAAAAEVEVAVADRRELALARSPIRNSIWSATRSRSSGWTVTIRATSSGRTARVRHRGGEARDRHDRV